MWLKLLPVILLAYAVVIASTEDEANIPATEKPKDLPETTTPATEKPKDPPETTTPATEKPTDPPETTTPATEKLTDPPETPTPATEKPKDPPETPTPATEKPTDPPETTTPATEKPTDPPKTTTPATEKPTDPSETTTPATEKPTDPPKTTTPATEKPTDPSETTTPATEKPTDPSEPTTPATEKPTDPSEPATPATDPPTSVHPSWEDYPTHVSNGDGKPPCIFSKMNITLTVTYETTDNKNETGTVSVPEKAKASGTCSDTESSMTLSWPAPTTLKTRYISFFHNVYAVMENQITFHFKNNNSRVSVDQIEIDIVLDKDHFPSAKESRLKRTTTKDLNLFATSGEGRRYVCSSAAVVSTTSGDIELSIKDVNLIAFNKEENLNQKIEENCFNEEVESANVGAIVGGVIAAVVVVGIVGYIIWRRKKNSYAHSEVP